MSKYDEKRMLSDLKLLSLDMINNAKSGYPGICLSSAPILYTLYAHHLVYDLERPDWCNRDRFVLSAGHAAPLLYAMIYASTEDFSLEDLKRYGQIDAPSKGLPELNISKRIEATTGPSGLGFATAVGMALGEKHLESQYNSKKITLFNYHVYCLCSDGDLMEGISYEAATLAGHYQLDNLIVLYDANKMTNEGPLPENYNDKIADMYVALGWDVLVIKKGDKLSEIDKAINIAHKNKQPTLIIVNTLLGDGSQYANTNKIHHKIYEDDLEQLRIKLKGLPPFEVNQENLSLFRKDIKLRVKPFYSQWYENYQKYLTVASDNEIEQLNDLIFDEEIVLDLEKVIDKDKLFLDKPMIDINFQIMNVIATFIDKFLGGSANLSLSTKVYLKNGSDMDAMHYQNKNIAFGVRENAMASILNGLALTNLRTFGATHLVYADYLKPSLRNTALMNLPVTYIFTHDTFLIGPDGAPNQPISQLAMLRSIPNLDVYRPCDYKELIGSWNLILKNKKPSALIISKYPTESYKFTSIDETSLGGYVISEVKSRLDVILIASGSEVTLAMKLKKELLKNFIESRIVSMPNIDAFFHQSTEYQNQVLPKGYKRMVIEFSNDPSLYRLVKSPEDLININHFGKSGTPDELLSDFGLDLTSLIIRIKNSI